MNATPNTAPKDVLSKVPAVTLSFWIIKILATTLGETGGDALSMSMNLGYLVSTGIFAGIFLIAVLAQIAAKKFHPFLYWTTIIATTTVGTTLADFVDRSLGIGYAGGTAILIVLLLASLFTWYRTLGSIAVHTVKSPKAEMFYWVTIMFSQTLGTALGDWTAGTAGLGYTGGAIVFGAMLAAEFQQTWNTLRPATQARNSSEAKTFDTIAAKIQAAKSSAEYGRLATPVLDAVDKLEKVFL